MVNRSKGAMGRSGVMDWITQRVTALILLAYVLFMVFFIGQHSPLSYPAWHDLFSMTAMRVFTILAGLSVVLHAWVGLWSILMDYVKCGCLRVFAKVAVVLVFVVEFIWLIDILWR